MWSSLLLPALASASIIRSSSSTCACTQLSTTIPEWTLHPGTEAYETERINVWDKRSASNPACIILPGSTEDVSATMKIIHGCDAQFAIRGGGHMNFPGANGIDQGILVALSRLSHTTPTTTSSINVGPGATWVDVYTALAPTGGYAIGGRLKSIGVPGLTLIGGVGYFHNKYGWSADTVRSYEVVLGDGRVVTASKTTNRDLFWALKGGANNFGIVTNFEFATFHIPKVSSTYQVFTEEHVEAFIHATVEMTVRDNGRVGAGGVFNIGYNASADSASALAFGTQEGEESPPSAFAPFTRIEGASVRVHNVTEPVVWHSQFETPNQMFRIQFGHHTMRPDARRLYRIYLAWREALKEIRDVEGLGATFVVNLLPRNIATPALTNGVGNVFGLVGENLIIWQIVTSWDREEDDARVTAWAQEFLSRLHGENKALGLAKEFIYMGDAGEWQKPYETYPKANVDRMRRVQDRVDPDGVFTRLNRGGFKLSV